MENYRLVSQWAASFDAHKVLKELLDFKAKYNWVKLPETSSFVAHMHEELPIMLRVIEKQEKVNAALREENARLNDYIKVNRMADELIMDDIKAKYPLVDI